MTFTEAAAQVLRLVGKPLHYKEITDVAIEKDLLSHVGKSPEVTMGARLAALVKKGDKDNPLMRVKPGVFALREWDKDTVEKGLSDRTPALERIAQKDKQKDKTTAEGDAENEAPAAEPLAGHREVDDDANPPDPEEQRRAAFAADASEIFAAEEDDDEPIFGGDDLDEERSESSSRRRRRRRRRPRNDVELGDGGDDLPSYTVSDVPEGVELDSLESDVKVDRPSRAQRGRREKNQAPVSLDSAGRALADSIEQLLGTFDKTRGSVSLQNLVDAAKRGGDAAADLGVTAALFGAVARSDNARRERNGERPRFRVNGNRLALEEWSLDHDLLAAERDLAAQVRRYRSLSEKALLKALAGLPHRAVGEVVILLLEALGLKEITPVRRPGTHGAELHLKAVLDGPGGEVRAAVVVRRDGREVGRERVTELRGALHHYGPAQQGYLVTTGQVLSGAREEARATGAAPVMLIDGARLAGLCFEHELFVRSTPLRLQIPDFALLDSLKLG